MLAFCGHSGLGAAHTKPKQAQCRLAQVRPTALGSLQALCEQATLADCPNESHDGPVRASPFGPRAAFVSFGPMQVLCRQPCNATRGIQTTLTSHSLATQLNWNGSNQKRPFQNLLLHIGQESSNLAHKIHFPAEFSSNLNQTHLSMTSGSLENHRWVSGSLQENGSHEPYLRCNRHEPVNKNFVGSFLPYHWVLGCFRFP